MAQIIVSGPNVASHVVAEIEQLLRAEGEQVETAIGDCNLLDLASLQQADAIVTIATACGADVIAAAPRLRAIVSPLIGYDWIDLAAATRRSIPVANSPLPENQESMAEATIMMMLTALYNLRGTIHSFWAAEGIAEPAPKRRMLKGKTIGLVGFGHLARCIADRLSTWEADIVAYSRYVSSYPGIRFVALDELCAKSDVVIMTARLEDDTRHVIDRDRLARFKPGSILVNTARGGLIEEAALCNALESGHIAQAMLDVFEQEPLPASSPLRALSNVMLTPHAVGHTEETETAMPQAAVDITQALLRGECVSSCVNPEVQKAIS